VQDDEQLKAGTQLRVSTHGHGVYERFEKNFWGANDHYIRFGSEDQSVAVKLRDLNVWDWEVLRLSDEDEADIAARAKELAESTAANDPAPAPPPAPVAVPSASAATSYKCLQKSQIRAGFEMDSDKAGVMAVGDVIDVLEARINDKGVLRIRFSGGWVSEKTVAGVTCLEAVAASAPTAAPSPEPTEPKHEALEAQNRLKQLADNLELSPEKTARRGAASPFRTPTSVRPRSSSSGSSPSRRSIAQARHEKQEWQKRAREKDTFMQRLGPMATWSSEETAKWVVFTIQDQRNVGRKMTDEVAASLQHSFEEDALDGDELVYIASRTDREDRRLTRLLQTAGQTACQPFFDAPMCRNAIHDMLQTACTQGQKELVDWGELLTSTTTKRRRELQAVCNEWMPKRLAIRDEIGHGSSGVVFSCMDMHRDMVAIKFSYSKEPKKIEREKELMDRVAHENVCRVHQYCSQPQGDGKLCALILELLDRTLKQCIDESSDGRLPESEVIHMALDILSGLAHVHDMGVIHRDVKPTNIMLSDKTASQQRSVYKLIDFSVSAMEQQEQSSVSETLRTATVTLAAAAGTAHYMSPEQFNPNVVVGSQTDLWSLGIVIFEALTGVLPFAAGETDHLKIGHAITSPVSRGNQDGTMSPQLEDAQVSSQMIDFLHQVLHTDVDKRIGSAVQMTTKLEEIQHRWGPEYFGIPSSHNLSQIPFAVEDLSGCEGVLQSLSSCLVPQEPKFLGRGRDVSAGTKAFWKKVPDSDRKLVVKRAWRVHHRSQWEQYAAKQQAIKSAVQRVHTECPTERFQQVSLRQDYVDATSSLPGQPESMDSTINEVYLMTGTPTENVLSMMEGGLNERFTQRANYGAGNYFAEDAAKNDQYTGSPDTEWDGSALHKLLYQRAENHPSHGLTGCAGVNYLMICRVTCGCPVRTNGKGRIPRCLDKGATSTSSDNYEDAIFWAHKDDIKQAERNFRKEMDCDDELLDNFPKESDRREYLRQAWTDKSPEEQALWLDEPDQSNWKELGRINGVGEPYLHYHSLIVETSPNEDEMIESIDRSLEYETDPEKCRQLEADKHSLDGGVERMREFVIFHGSQVYTEYLVAYSREGA